ncbi:Fic family protein [Tsukamurella sputi]|uniref:Fic family protein n=1 Tax=Tsukamurella sputi TaxID=2591848 RepID=A0A5C5RMV5_9ACTN|nr:Fic family protein [Tsukamurella sputi]TWS24002.1 Fic family protein [Tsukamurella sputi]
MAEVGIADLAGVVYSAGKVFDGLSTGRLDTENFLRSGSLDGVASRADLALLEDLRDAAQYVLGHVGEVVDAGFVRAVNATMTRSGALHPGRLRTADQAIGVSTRYGRHEPTALTEAGLQEVIDAATSGDVIEDALELFVRLARAQPFEDGNKRTAIMVANALLLGAGAGVLLTVPVDDGDPDGDFNDLLARAYRFDEVAAVKDLLRRNGLAPTSS